MGCPRNDEGVAKTLASSGVRCNSVHLYAVDTDILFGLEAETITELVSTIPMGRSGKPAEVAEIVTFFERCGKLYHWC